MKVQYEGRHPEGVEVPLPDGGLVEFAHGEAKDVPDEVGAGLLEQEAEWAPADAKAKRARQQITSRQADEPGAELIDTFEEFADGKAETPAPGEKE